MKHILLSNLNFKHVAAITPLIDYSYNNNLGAWISPSNKLLINDKEFVSVGSKKKDIETGEDQK